MTENSSNECPTEILVHLEDCEFMPSLVNSEEIQTPLDGQKSLKYSEDKENVLFETKGEKYQCIMDMSPFSLEKKWSDPVLNSEQVSRGAVNGIPEENQDCPSAVLIEVPSSSSNMCPKQYPVPNYNKVKCHKKQECITFGQQKCRLIKESGNPYDLTAMKTEFSPTRPRWKTPSPESMALISQEASQIIYNLNTSTLLDGPLCEESMPLPINFDLNNSDEENLILNSAQDPKSVSIEAVSPQVMSEENLNEGNITSSITSSELQSFSLDKNETEEMDNVFIENNLSSEDKENILKGEEKEVLPNKVPIGCGAAENVFLRSKKEMKNRKTLSNVSNVDYDMDARNSPCIKKINANNYLKPNSKLNSKEFVYRGKQPLKKSVSEEPRTVPKRMFLGSSFQSGSSRESTFSFPKPNSIKQTTSLSSECKSSSSDVENGLTPVRTPLRRYSIATPLQSASVKKPAVTPAVPRFTPQCPGSTRLSFSKSWQHPNMSNSVSAVRKPSVNRMTKAPNQSIPKLSVETSKNPSVSTSSKNRFSSKLSLPSPLLAGQERKLARALFPSK